MFYIPLDTKWVILEMLFPANLLATYYSIAAAEAATTTITTTNTSI